MSTGTPNGSANGQAADLPEIRPPDGSDFWDTAIVGGGPGGMGAALYAARALMKTILVDRTVLGGALLLTEHIANYAGFPEGVGGFELAQRMEAQIRNYDVDIRMLEVGAVEFDAQTPRFFRLVTADGIIRTRTIIMAAGNTARKLPAKGAEEFFGRGVSTCAVCDGAFYRDRAVAVVGGGDSAVEEGLFLTRFASEVHIIHRRDEFRAEKIFQREAEKNPKIHIHFNRVVTEVLGDQFVTGVTMADTVTGGVEHLPVEGVFVYIGSTPNSAFIKVPVAKDSAGYLIANKRTQTNIPGFFAIGDVVSGSRRQVAISVGEGCIAALEAENYITELERHVVEPAPSAAAVEAGAAAPK
ncbi:MAG TPA: FAD-dependent oxidoreductase [bacterium]|nr:FAD-dependent oxidoreductase [bacterium]